MCSTGCCGDDPGCGHGCHTGAPVRGLLHIAILKAVRDKPAHGGEIHHVLKERYGIEAPRPVIYGLLRRLEGQGLLVSRWDVERGGPAKRVYMITDEGVEYLENVLKRLSSVRDVINRLISS